MTYTKHTTHTDALDTLGSIIGPDEKRDAIHIAVVVAIAHVRLAAGQHVVLGSDGEASPTSTNDGVGIVDPYLSRVVEPGERFWLLLYPRQITSLRHVWEHPDFPASGETGVNPADDKVTAEAWLRDWCEHADCPDFEITIAAAMHGGDETWDDDYLHFRDRDAHGEIPDEFWRQLSIYTGEQFNPDDNPSHFSCSC